MKERIDWQFHPEKLITAEPLTKIYQLALIHIKLKKKILDKFKSFDRRVGWINFYVATSEINLQVVCYVIFQEKNPKMKA